MARFWADERIGEPGAEAEDLQEKYLDQNNKYKATSVEAYFPYPLSRREYPKA